MSNDSVDLNDQNLNLGETAQRECRTEQVYSLRVPICLGVAAPDVSTSSSTCLLNVKHTNRKKKSRTFSPAKQKPPRESVVTQL